MPLSAMQPQDISMPILLSSLPPMVFALCLQARCTCAAGAPRQTRGRLSSCGSWLPA